MINQNNRLSNIFKSNSVLVLIIANLIPLFGVIFFSWNVFNIILLYLTEYFIIGFFSFIKIAIPVIKSTNFTETSLGIKVFVIFWFLGAFCIYMGFLWGLFSLPFAWLLMFLNPYLIDNSLFITLKDTFINNGLIFAVISIFLSHSYSFYYNFIVKDEADIWIKNVNRNIGITFLRLIFIYPVIFTGGLIALFFGNLPLLIIFIIYKTVIDLTIHIKEHNLYKTGSNIVP